MNSLSCNTFSLENIAFSVLHYVIKVTFHYNPRQPKVLSLFLLLSRPTLEIRAKSEQNLVVSSGEEVDKNQSNSSCVIMSVIS